MAALQALTLQHSASWTTPDELERVRPFRHLWLATSTFDGRKHFCLSMRRVLADIERLSQLPGH
jgi:hypothetical protein